MFFQDFVLNVDASDNGLGVFLEEETEREKLAPVASFCESLTASDGMTRQPLTSATTR